MHSALLFFYGTTPLNHYHLPTGLDASLTSTGQVSCKLEPENSLFIARRDRNLGEFEP